jgi:AraC family transcriptional regulator
MSGDLLDGVSQGWRQTTCRGEEPAPPSRTRLLRLAVGLVEDVRSAPGDRQNGSEGFSADFQLCLPYRGMLVWHVGRDAVVGDANQMLFVTGGEKYRISQPHPEGYGELIVTPELSVLAEIANSVTDRLPSHPLFRRRSRLASPRLQSFRARFLSWATRASAPGDGGPRIEHDELMAEELVIALLRAALSDGNGHRDEARGSTDRLIRRTKAFLEAEFANPIRLADVGRAVGASPAYLTHVFRRVEGTSLHQYLTQLRLARALVDLPWTDDLTALALETGFSSHSHFTRSFRRSFGVTPSAFRQMSRGGVRPPPLEITE